MSWIGAQPYGRAAVVCHAGVIRALGATALNIPLPAFDLPVLNGAVCVMSCEAGKWRITRWNCGYLSSAD